MQTTVIGSLGRTPTMAPRRPLYTEPLFPNRGVQPQDYDPEPLETRARSFQKSILKESALNHTGILVVVESVGQVHAAITAADLRAACVGGFGVVVASAPGRRQGSDRPHKLLASESERDRGGEGTNNKQEI